MSPQGVLELNLGGSGTSPSRNPIFKGVVGESLRRLSGIESIVLENFDLKSEIPASLGQLSNLFQLVLGKMGLMGKIPASIGNLKKLQNFNVNNNALVGPLPVELCKLVNIEYVDFGGNQLGGVLPACIGSSWKLLKEMDFRNNALSGPLPEWIGNLQSLQLLWLNKNRFTGRLPSTFGKLNKLELLDLSEIQISGPLPKELGSMKSLNDLVCTSNKISGTVPAQFGNLAQLAHLYLDRNQISGSIPAFLGNMKKLTLINLSRNKLSGSIPPQLGNLADDESVQMDFSNRLTGPVPPDLGGIRGGILVANNNALTGGFNLALAGLSSINLGNNRLSDTRKIGTLPPGANNQLFSLSLANNRFSGQFPSWIFEPTYFELDLSGNRFQGSILPFFDRNINNLNLSSNPLATTLPTATFKAASLSLLDLSNCQLSGPITSQFLFNLNPAVSIYFKNNKLSGPLPQHIGSSLFRCNLLNGTVPASLSKLDELTFLDLSGNQFIGPVPCIP